jgi:hypothetical protein
MRHTILDLVIELHQLTENVALRWTICNEKYFFRYNAKVSETTYQLAGINGKINHFSASQGKKDIFNYDANLVSEFAVFQDLFNAVSIRTSGNFEVSFKSLIAELESFENDKNKGGAS